MKPILFAAIVTALAVQACGKPVATGVESTKDASQHHFVSASEVLAPPEVSQEEREKFKTYTGGYFDLRLGEDYLGEIPAQTEKDSEGAGADPQSFQMSFIIQPGLLYHIYGTSAAQQVASSGVSSNSVYGGGGAGGAVVRSGPQPQTNQRVSLCISVIESGGSDPRVVSLVKQRGEKALRDWIAIAESHPWANQNKKGVRGVDVIEKPGCRPITITLHHSYEKSSSVCRNGRACAFAGGTVYLPNNAYSTSELTIAHELGHVLGLGDTYQEAGYIKLNKPQPPSVMNAQSHTLTHDDKTGILLIMDSLQNGQKIPSCGRGYTMDYSGIENRNNNRYCLPTGNTTTTQNNLPGAQQPAPVTQPSQPIASQPSTTLSRPVQPSTTAPSTTCRTGGVMGGAGATACR